MELTESFEQQAGVIQVKLDTVRSSDIEFTRTAKIF